MRYREQRGRQLVSAGKSRRNRAFTYDFAMLWILGGFLILAFVSCPIYFFRYRRSDEWPVTEGTIEALLETHSIGNDNFGPTTPPCPIVICSRANTTLGPGIRRHSRRASGHPAPRGRRTL